MNLEEISPIIREKAPLILEEIKKAKNILLHCHPLPDPDSTSSALAMKFALEQLGKEATIIRGDSVIPEAFLHFPGVSSIENVSFPEIDLSKFDLFLSLDSGSPNMVSQKKPPVFPLPIKTIVIDHHASNGGYGEINLIDTSSPATAFIIYQLLKSWNIKITPDMATNLFMGMYTDTGGFKYPPTDYKVLEATAELAKISPDFTETIFVMENSQRKEMIYYQALALSSVKTFLNENIAIAAVSNKELVEKQIPEECIRGLSISNILKAVIGWNVGVSLIEQKPGEVKASFRTRDRNTFDVSKLASALGGGGHRAAAAAVLKMSLPEAIDKVVATAKDLYNL